MVCFRNIVVDTLHKGDTGDNNNNNNNNNNHIHTDKCGNTCRRAKGSMKGAKIQEFMYGDT
jgi:restriction endonuclease Mrr